MTYLKIVASESEYNTYKLSEDFGLPNVTAIGTKDDSDVWNITDIIYTPKVVIPEVTE